MLVGFESRKRDFPFSNVWIIGMRQNRCEEWNAFCLDRLAQDWIPTVRGLSCFAMHENDFGDIDLSITFTDASSGGIRKPLSYATSPIFVL
jgi:hypothetical protein